MKITLQDVERIAFLSRLELTQEEKEDQLRELTNILEALEVLNKIDTGDVEPFTYVLPLKNVFRQDELGSMLPKEKVLQNAPLEEEGMFKVPKIM